MRFFGRVAALTVGTRRMTQHRITFSVRRTWTSEPNAAEVSIYNLGPDSLAECRVGRPAFLEAGWQDRTARIASGKVLYVQTKRDGPDRVTTLWITDGGREIATALTSETFSANADLATMVKKFAADLGVGADQAIKRVKQGDARGAIDAWVNGFTANGKTADEMTKTLSAAGFDWSIQDGELMVLRPGETLKDAAIRVGPDSGLVGSPEVNSPVSGNIVVPMKTVNFASLLNPLIRPGSRVALDGLEMKGMVAVATVVHGGDTHGGEWQSKVEGWLR